MDGGILREIWEVKDVCLNKERQSLLDFKYEEVEYS